MIGQMPPQAAVNGLGQMPPQASANGFGAYFTQQPPQPGGVPMSGLGAVGAIKGMGQPYYGGAGFTALGIAMLGLAGYLSYQAGSAMAPGPARKKTWGWIGVPVGLLTGPIGLGVMGVISNQKS